MKKKLHSEIMELAKQMLKADEAFNVTHVKETTKALYEKLAVLEYLESQVQGKGNVTLENEESMDSKSFREENWFTEPEQLPQSQHKDDLVEPLMEKIKDIVAQMPEETHELDEMLEEVLPQKKYVKNDLEEFANTYQQTPTFERKEPKKPIASVAEKVQENETQKMADVLKEVRETILDVEEKSEKPKSLNEAVNKGMSIGLNDRLAFIKHLFEGSAEDYTRVLSQINTLHTLEEANAFIDRQVKPDYNNWLDKDEFTERFMAIVERRFN